MSVDEIAQLATQLTPGDRLRLVEKIVHDLAETTNAKVPEPRRSWSELSGLIEGSAYGEDAQAWVTRTRQEWDEQRNVR